MDESTFAYTRLNTEIICEKCLYLMAQNNHWIKFYKNNCFNTVMLSKIFIEGVYVPSLTFALIWNKY